MSTTTQVRVRRAGRIDLKDAVTLFEAELAGAPAEWLAWDEEEHHRLTGFVASLLVMPYVAAFIAYAGSEPIGQCMVQVFSRPYGKPRLVAEGLTWYVTPEHRGGWVASDLYRHGEAFALACGAKIFELPLRPEGLIRKCEAMGYQRITTRLWMAATGTQEVTDGGG